MHEIFAAFLAALKGVSPTAEPFPVLDWSDPKLTGQTKPTRYLAVADFTPSRHNPRLSAHRGVSGHLFAVTVVAETANEVRAACDRMRDRLEGVRLTAGTGETSTTPLYQDEGNDQPVDVLSDTANPRLFHAVELWRCATTRVPVA